jgi:hypothetical protein
VKKIISLFKRDYDGSRSVYDEVVEGAEWVINGEGKATRKYDGTCCMIEDGRLWKRYEVKKNKKAPPSFRAATEVDPITGKQQGWVPVGDGPEDKWYREAYEMSSSYPGYPDGTYELLGPKVQGNPEGFDHHELEPHGAVLLPDCPRDFEGIKTYLSKLDIEGIVWHHPDGRMVKIKKKDFGLKRKEIRR